MDEYDARRIHACDGLFNCGLGCSSQNLFAKSGVKEPIPILDNFSELGIIRKSAKEPSKLINHSLVSS